LVVVAMAVMSMVMVMTVMVAVRHCFDPDVD
jgi:hypothetical protein